MSPWQRCLKAFAVLCLTLLPHAPCSASTPSFPISPESPLFVRSSAPSEQRMMYSALESPDITERGTDFTRRALPNQDLHVPEQVRLMVFAPHPDDETIASGGLIQRVLARGGVVRVVFVTNGDGFLDGIQYEFKDKEPTPGEFVEYGKLRHAEALKAISELGLQPADALFFGFPDGGIDYLWEANWSKLHPYTSPYTLFDHPKYQDVFSRWVKYAGMDLKEQIIRTLRDFRPDWVVIPDPRDTHPDHCTTGLFVLDGLRKLKDDGEEFMADVQEFTYLVHYLDYPSANGWLSEVKYAGVGGARTSQGVLPDTQWMSLPISTEELAVKDRALQAHDTQIDALNRFLKEFLKHYEMFGRLGSEEALALPSEYAARMKHSQK